MRIIVVVSQQKQGSIFVWISHSLLHQYLPVVPFPDKRKPLLPASHNLCVCVCDQETHLASVYPPTTAYAAACAVEHITLDDNQTTLALPADWDGPFGQGLSVGATAVTLAAALLVGFGSIAIVNTM